jgi:hypothetical protein
MISSWMRLDISHYYDSLGSMELNDNVKIAKSSVSKRLKYR